MIKIWKRIVKWFDFNSDIEEIKQYYKNSSVDTKIKHCGTPNCCLGNLEKEDKEARNENG